MKNASQDAESKAKLVPNHAAEGKPGSEIEKDQSEDKKCIRLNN